MLGGKKSGKESREESEWEKVFSQTIHRDRIGFNNNIGCYPMDIIQSSWIKWRGNPRMKIHSKKVFFRGKFSRNGFLLQKRSPCPRLGVQSLYYKPYAHEKSKQNSPNLITNSRKDFTQRRLSIRKSLFSCKLKRMSGDRSAGQPFSSSFNWDLFKRPTSQKQASFFL